jgi:hypothetical protein
MNEPVIIDTTAPRIKPMTIDEIVNDIIGKICTDDEIE